MSGPLLFGRGSSRRLVVLGAVFVLLAIMLVPTVRAYFAQRDANAALGDKVARQQQTVDQLRADIERYNDPAFVERQARERLGWVKPGETAWRVTGGQDSSAGRMLGGMAIPADPDGARPYYERIWTSVLIADRTTEGGPATQPLPTATPPTGETSLGTTR